MSWEDEEGAAELGIEMAKGSTCQGTSVQCECRRSSHTTWSACLENVNMERDDITAGGTSLQKPIS